MLRYLFVGAFHERFRCLRRSPAAMLFIVLPLPPRRAAVAGSRAYRKWRGAAPLHEVRSVAHRPAGFGDCTRGELDVRRFDDYWISGAPRGSHDFAFATTLIGSSFQTPVGGARRFEVRENARFFLRIVAARRLNKAARQGGLPLRSREVFDPLSAT